MKEKIKNRLKGVGRILVCALFCLVAMLSIFQNGAPMSALSVVSAQAYAHDLIEIQAYDVDMTIQKNRTIDVKESIRVQFLASGLTMFYRSLPMEGARYSNITASCPGNPDFDYYVEDNPDVDGFFDVNCVGGAEKGNVWTYEITYTMEQGTPKGPKEGMILDVIGFGWTVPLHNVSATLHFPERAEIVGVYSDIFGENTENQVSQTTSSDGKTLTLTAEMLDLGYSDAYDEVVAGGLTVEFTLPEGTLESYTSIRMFTEDIWKIALACLGVVGIAVLLHIFTHNKREMITVVNVKAPEEMDPMKMGKLLDGSVDNEDVTSMIYYFADKGYLQIDLTDEEDPLLIPCVGELPTDAPIYEKTLFNGLFKKGSAHVSELVGNFYDAMLQAQLQMPNGPTMYETKSILGYLGGGIIGSLLGFLTCLFMGMRLGGGYTYGLGLTFLIPILFITLIGFLRENYRYKWKPALLLGMRLAQLGIVVLWSVIFCLAFAQFFMTEWEKILLCVGVFGATFATQWTLSRTETYTQTLGNILGFKDFIVVTEEDKIKVMLEEKPELYYHILPYAQVLGVTDEWEGKFARLTVEPPRWYVGGYTTFDYYLISRSMNRAMTREIAKEMNRRSNSGGGSVGRSGGGGSFGSFGGGGFGGGGGGAR
ncbi:MAG: DUF2207 domain-containing protein [Clostridia bacterium]|nr:DUF2207 domain-containing protein [Clostridia bacterium]